MKVVRLRASYSKSSLDFFIPFSQMFTRYIIKQQNLILFKQFLLKNFYFRCLADTIFSKKRPFRGLPRFEKRIWNWKKEHPHWSLWYESGWQSQNNDFFTSSEELQDVELCVIKRSFCLSATIMPFLQNIFTNVRS